jgi:hypothetical protein
MSQENVALLYRWYEAFREHDNEARALLSPVTDTRRRFNGTGSGGRRGVGAASRAVLPP